MNKHNMASGNRTKKRSMGKTTVISKTGKPSVAKKISTRSRTTSKLTSKIHHRVAETKQTANAKSATVDNKKKYFLRITILLVVALLFGIFMTSLIYLNYKLLDYKEVIANVTIVSHGVGLNADPQGILFGKNFPGGGATRSFFLSTKQEARVRIFATGNISNMITFSEDNFILEPNESRRIYVDLIVPLDTQPGPYSGRIKVYILRP